ncbi:phospholipase [Aggregicoccus sp. 17bor-14]|uniref:alpha/beta hydrolase n=1 Tax=Myxococcaceae TaxID=31 RepID=UPI00129CB570|nr:MULTISPECIES: alpha/beta hydrolase-fold protein [Myxococcaceae]MBF5046420.1 phospholipase [Simulacricoccus sp. 17bor-14]MRI92139.1 phospholipase [Aggregicoccus sp. 17bor-14]
MTNTEAQGEGRLSVRPARHPGPFEPLPAGVQSLGLGSPRDGLLYVPVGYRPERPAPLALMLHGAGGDAAQGLSVLRAWADEAGLLVLAPDSRGPTWDLILDDFGADVAFLERALAQVFARCSVDPERLAIAGFSDGASYALSLGLTNGTLFTHVLAFSPGFMAPAARRGHPRIYVSHGTRDAVLPIGACSRRLVPRLEHEGYDVRYVEFDGPHTVPPALAHEALGLLREGPRAEQASR